ncbi:MAG: hypothetical protein P8X86_14320 [Desulfofustis sp.]
MAHETIPLMGGKSVHCINEQQMAEAWRLTEQEPGSSAKIQAALEKLEQDLTRNERAALAFVIISRLKATSPLPQA